MKGMTVSCGKKTRRKEKGKNILTGEGRWAGWGMFGKWTSGMCWGPQRGRSEAVRA